MYVEGSGHFKEDQNDKTGKILNIEDVYAAQEFDFTGPREYDEKTGYRTKSMLVIPMKNHEGEVIGVSIRSWIRCSVRPSGSWFIRKTWLGSPWPWRASTPPKLICSGRY